MSYIYVYSTSPSAVKGGWEYDNLVDALVAEKILRHLGAGHDPPPRPPPPDGSGPYTYEPCEDVDPIVDDPRGVEKILVDPMPDYENVLTD